MSPMNFLHNNPIIAAVRELELLDAAMDSEVELIFLMCGSISEIEPITRIVQHRQKKIFLHVDLIKGLGRDRDAVDFVIDAVGPDGIVSTRPQLVQVALARQLLSVLQIFMIDSQAFDSGLKNILALKPNAVEIMPGLMPRVAAEIKSYIDIPLIAAGLIKQEHEVRAMLAAGCEGVAVSHSELWNYRPDR